MKEVCYDCGKEMKTFKTGVKILEEKEDGTPYKVWNADIKKCPECGHKVFCGFGDRPTAHDCDENFKSELLSAEYTFR